MIRKSDLILRLEPLMSIKRAHIFISDDHNLRMTSLKMSSQVRISDANVITLVD
jgi:hypothetical protein